MAKSHAALELDLTPPALAAARTLAEAITAGEPLQRGRLLEIVAAAYGSTCGQGQWQIRHAFDLLEAGQVLALRTIGLPPAGPERLDALSAITMSLPTQSVRSEAQIAYQQFSTPLPIAWLLARAATIGHADMVLEPSAGTGLLAIQAEQLGARVVLNELDPWRTDLLGHAFPDVPVTRFDAELIDDFLAPDIRPDVVLINPPFARSVGRGADRWAGLRHLQAALRRLSRGGRCAAILPAGLDLDGAPWTMATQGAGVTLQLDLPANAYAKHGTSQAVQIIVLEKGGSAPARRVACATLAEALRAIDDIAAAQTISATAVSATADTAAVALVRRPRAAALFGGLVAAPRNPLAARRADAPSSLSQAVTYDALDTPAAVEAPSGLYLPYRPSRVRIDRSTPHPTALVESIAMGSIAAPKPNHVPCLPASVLAQQILSDAQLETLIYAGTAFERDLPGRFTPDEGGVTLTPSATGQSYRTGFFIGDGTGAGKGRQVAATILDQWLRGRRRHIWISKTETLLEDARRDWCAVGGLALDVQHLNQWKLGTPIGASEAVLFLTYATLRSGRGDKGTRLQQILDWAGEDFDGVIVFDEAHEMAGVAGGEGRFGTAKGSDQGIAGVRLQNCLPRARVLYVSATGASDVNNLAYATRLGLWGPETAFADRREFVENLRRGGIAAMELIARDLKAQGLYAARALSFAGVEYDILEHQLTPDQIAIYDAYAEAWAIIHRNLHAALDATRVVDALSSTTYNSGAKAAALSIFESTKQRFFGQLLISMKLPSLVPAIRADLARGDCVVIQLVSTSEAMLDRALAALGAEERAQLDIELSPREFVMDYLTAAFPVRQMRTFLDETGKTRSEPMIDEAGQPVISREAVRMRDAMLEELGALPVIGSALDHLIGHFGTDAVAEVTGRRRRIVIDPDGRQRIERRSARTNLAETDAFMRGAKRILIFSDAGGTGRSYHASLEADNRARRIHYLLEPGWRADAAIQGLGRTHRTHQACAPLFRPVSTDCRGERRFISTIARRLDSLGALTRGQRQTGGQGLFDPRDNLESDYARESLESWFQLLASGKLSSISLGDFEHLTGLQLSSPDGGLVEDLPPIQRWLNRILALRIALQNAIFDEYLGLIEARIEAAREAGRLDLGVETIVAEKITILDRTVIRRDPVSGAETELLQLETEERYRPQTLEQVAWMLDNPRARRIVNRRSGRAAICRPTHSLTDEEGRPVLRFELVRPTRTERQRQDLFLETLWEDAGPEEFEALWNDEVAEARARVHKQTLYLVTGLLLPIWGKLPDDHVQVWRLTTDDGQSLLGRIVPGPLVSRLVDSLGGATTIVIPPAEIVRHVLSTGATVPAGPYRLKRSLVAGEQRLELIDWPHTRLAELKAAGCFTEIIQHRTRLFLPVATAPAIFDRIAA